MPRERETDLEPTQGTFNSAIQKVCPESGRREANPCGNQQELESGICMASPFSPQVTCEQRMPKRQSSLSELGIKVTATDPVEWLITGVEQMPEPSRKAKPTRALLRSHESSRLVSRVIVLAFGHGLEFGRIVLPLLGLTL